MFSSARILKALPRSLPIFLRRASANELVLSSVLKRRFHTQPLKFSVGSFSYKPTFSFAC